jgi:hypothetical protein
MVTDWAFDSLSITDLAYACYVYLFDELSALTDVVPAMVQTSTNERLWLATRTMTRIKDASAGSFLDSLGAPTQHTLKPYKVIGVTVDSNENPVASAEVYLLRGDFRGYSMVQKCTSDASGNYLFYVDDPADQYVVVAFKAGVEEVRGVTTRTLTAVAV